MLVDTSRHHDSSKTAYQANNNVYMCVVWGGGVVGREGERRTISHMLDSIIVQHLPGIPRVAALCQQVSQGFIVHLDEGGLHGILPPRLPQLAGCLQDLQGKDSLLSKSDFKEAHS